ncbi:hypothetical protein FNO01nite_20860 [Flavobacterium noncentrifugens]|uniref:Lipid-binding hydrolase n=1 Tax=Flavobacterium noncentrifugens TaxID=1128970 RepID=A0A1G8YZ69_9FLAO|nr:hypothetical protein [Flavobacterium noncentrifugens]GEP51414.1 hypothetical protein FNO01nite_20860 [Flavobacterium noncentrifugens]SDK08081.1 hypothetical protein SAMN04487935_2535 [Flavobacterium noncentrifugens]
MKPKIFGIAILFAFSTSVTSCNDNDDEVQIQEAATPFFNLKTGNKWVYKKYQNSESEPTVFTFSGITDNVEIVGEIVVNGLTFSKVHHTHRSIPQEAEYEYWRVNNLGHLIVLNIEEISQDVTEEMGATFHPGTDIAYQSTITKDFFTIYYHVTPEINLIVEGKNYTVLPYKGDITPAGSPTGTVTKTVEYNFQKGIGLVKGVGHVVTGNYSWEDRLVSYDLVE